MTSMVRKEEFRCITEKSTDTCVIRFNQNVNTHLNTLWGFITL